MKILVVYYSLTGHTRRVAERLARLLDASALAITEPVSRKGMTGYLRSLFEAVAGRDAAIEPPPRDPAAYDLVIIGTPVWGWHLSSPVRALARQWGGRMPQVAFFATMGGSGSDRAFEELRRLVGRKPLAEVALTERECQTLATTAVNARLESFARRLRSAARARQQHEAA